MQVNSFTIIPADSFIWNQYELLSFLLSNQGNDIVLHTNEEGCCLQSIGLYKILDLFKFNTVTIISNNIFEFHKSYKIINEGKCFKFFNVSDSTNYSKFHTWNKSKIFGVLYNRAIWHRIGLASYLNTKHSKISAINFRANPKDIDARPLFEIQTLFEIHPESIDNFTQSHKTFPIQLKGIDDYTVGVTTTQHTDQLCILYPDFLIDIVAETFIQGRTFFVTEKTVRSILLKKPFIVMGPKCFLIHLRQMGFKTFNDFWSEDYDGYPPEQKYEMILQLIDSIAGKSIEELYKMYNDMQSILDHNYNLLITKTFSTSLNYVE
jgi:hypothetical protein